MNQKDFFDMTDGAEERYLTDMIQHCQLRQFSAAKEEPQMKKQIRHTTKHGMLTGIAAAAAVLICGTVTVGAIADWHYTDIFSRMFSERTGTESSFDLTGFGKDLGEVFTGEHFTLTLTSLLADDYTVLAEYELELDDTYSKRPDEEYFEPHVYMDFYGEKDGKAIDFMEQGESSGEWVDETGSYHGYFRLGFPDQQWSGAELYCILDAIAVNRSNPAYISNEATPDVCFIENRYIYELENRRYWKTLEDVPESVDVRELGTVDCAYEMQQIKLEAPAVIHNANKIRDEFWYAAVSPISLMLTEEAGTMRNSLANRYHGSDQLCLNTPEIWYGRSDGTFTVTYKDGTEAPVACEAQRERFGSQYFGDVFITFYFDQPIDLESVDHFTFNETVIPVR